MEPLLNFDEYIDIYDIDKVLESIELDVNNINESAFTSILAKKDAILKAISLVKGKASNALKPLMNVVKTSKDPAKIKRAQSAIKTIKAKESKSLIHLHQEKIIAGRQHARNVARQSIIDKGFKAKTKNAHTMEIMKAKKERLIKKGLHGGTISKGKQTLKKIAA